MDKIRVMVVDDSALMRKLISEILMKDPDLEVVSTAMDGVFALKKIPLSRPQVITMDIDMPRMDGLTALRHIVSEYRIPVVLVSSMTTEGAEVTLEGLALGAVDFVTKPKDAISVHIRDAAEELIRKVKMASGVAIKHPAPISVTSVRRRRQPAPMPKLIAREPAEQIIAIGISTGGPNAISTILPQLPHDFGAALLIVQHMPEGFTEAFANRLDQACKIQVKEARDGDQLFAGTALIAPGNKHLKVAKVGSGGLAVISSSAPVNGHRPSADVLFESVSREFGPDAIGLIMTGMGEDGARGLGAIKAAGGHTMAQDEESCVVYGMPKAAVERGHAREIVPLTDIPTRLMTLVKEVPAYAELTGHAL